MKTERKLDKKTFSLVIISLLVGILVGASFVYAQSSSQLFTISQGIYPGAASITIYQDGSNYYGKDEYGKLLYSNSDPDVLINQVLEDLNGDATVQEEVQILGDIIVDDTIDIASNMRLVIDGRLRLDTGANCHLLSGDTKNNFEIIVHGELNGLKAGQTTPGIIGVILWECFNFRLDINYITNCLGSGLVLGYCHNFEIDHLTVLNCNEGNVRFQNCYAGHTSYLATSGSLQGGLHFVRSNGLSYGLTFDYVGSSGNSWHGIEFSGLDTYNGTGEVIFGYVECFSNSEHGIVLDNAYRVIINGGNIKNNNQAELNFSGILMQNGPGGGSQPVQNCILSNLIVSDDQAVKTQQWGLQEIEVSDYNIISNCQFIGNVLGGIQTIGANTKVSNSYNGTSWIS